MLSDRIETDEFAVEVYERILDGDGGAEIADRLGVPAAEVDRAFGLLRRLRLIRETRNGEVVAVDPDSARTELLLPLERAIHDQRSLLLARRRQLRSFADAFGRAERANPRHWPIQVSRDPRETELRLVETANGCQAEVLMMQSCVAHEPPEARHLRPLVLDALRRGIRVRVLYPHAARADAATRSFLCNVASLGGRVRTSDEIFDREVAFLRAGLEGDQAVAMVHGPVIAQFLAGTHDRGWESGTDFDPGRSGYDGTLDVVKSRVLDLLAAGLKDEVIARRVGLSERTLRRHISAMMQELAAESRFQAGVAAARAGLVATTTRS
ncbi:helix-turn-helix transcriptional regulator [Amycolatopsis japonica]|uniref:helix-turn-helix transcriptional regulator n=1 Tax=Amycolatopsis japonica TaxID=208439 RepID=UPI0033180875